MQVSSDENLRMFTQISLKCVLNGAFNNKTTLTQITAWHQTGNKQLAETMMVWFNDVHMTHSKGRFIFWGGSNGHVPPPPKKKKFIYIYISNTILQYCIGRLKIYNIVIKIVFEIYTL